MFFKQPQKMKKLLLLLVFVCSQALGQTITISSPAANYNVCQATNFNIVFSASGFNVGNVFTAEISNFNGSFIIPITTIGSLSGTNSGTIIGNIPNSVFFSINYRIRIKSSNPEVISDGVVIRVGVVEPYLYLQNGYAGYQYACASAGGLLVGISFPFNYDPVSDFTFVWKKNNVNVTALNQSSSAPFAFGRPPVLSQSDAGAYKLEITNNNGNCTVITNTQNVLIANAYNAPTTANQTIASGSTATLTASNCAGIVYWYDVSIPPNLSHLATGTFTTPVLTQTTTYYAACGDIPWCFSPTTPLTVTVTQQPPTQPANFITSTNSLCQGTSNVIYTVPNVSGVMYNWTYSGTGATFSGTTNSVSVNFANNATSGTLSVTATNSAGTSSARTLAVTVNTIPALPSASGVTVASGSMASLTATGCSVYNWYAQSSGGAALQSGASSGFTTPNLYAGTTYYVACVNGICESNRTSVAITVTGGSSAVLVAHYPFCGSANDISSNANHGTLNGATPTTDRFGNPNSAYNFNGSSSYISVPSTGINNFGTANFTTSIWFKTSSITPVLALYTKSENTEPTYAGINAYVNADNIGSVRARTDFNNAVEASGTYNNGQWHLMTFTRNGTTQKIYVDGVMKATQISGSVINVSQNTPLIIGRNTGVDYFFNGQLDDFKLYNGVLSDAEILAEFNVSCQMASCGSPINITPMVSNSGPVNAGQTVNLIATNLAPRGQAITLSSASSQYIEVPQVLPGNNFTIEMWMKTSQANVGIFEAGSSSISNFGSDRHIYLEGGVLKARIIPEAIPGFSSGKTLNDNQWHHIAITHTTTGGVGSAMYVDGALTATFATNVVCDGSLPVFRIGVEQNTGWFNSSPNNFFTGQIDQVRIWNVVRTLSEIRGTAQLETPSNNTGIVYQSNLNGNANASIGTNGSLINAPTFTNVTHYTYAWTGQNAPIASNNETQTTTGAAGTSYSLNVTPIICGTVISGATTVTINGGPPQPGAIVGGNVACQGRLGLTYLVPAVTGATSYTWTYSGTGISFVGGISNTRTVTLDLSFAATSGTLSVTANNASGSSQATTLAISISPAPAAPTASGVTIAQGATSSLTATGCLIYKWYETATIGTPTLFTGQNFTTSPLTSTTNYYVACNPGTSCESPRVLVTVTVPCTQMYTLKTGIWSDVTVWSCNRTPMATDNITVEFGHIVSIPAGTFQVKNITEKGILNFLPSGILNIVGGL